MTHGRIKEIQTTHGKIQFPAFMPVTTFSDKYPLDKMVQPYLKRMSQCLMVSYYYAQNMKQRPDMPVFMDSGGFASLFDGTQICSYGDYGTVKWKDGTELNPLDVLHFQIKNADIGATLDFIIPPGLEETECIRLQNLTIQNALYAQRHNITGNLILYASLQCWDAASARKCARVYAEAGFAGIAIGGFVPRAKDPEYIKSTVRAVREAAPDCAIHVFGCGNPEIIPALIALGADSFDSSSYVRGAVNADQSLDMGIHGNLYAALKRLYEINALVSGEKASIGEVIPNYAIFEKYSRSSSSV